MKSAQTGDLKGSKGGRAHLPLARDAAQAAKARAKVKDNVKGGAGECEIEEHQAAETRSARKRQGGQGITRGALWSRCGGPCSFCRGGRSANRDGRRRWNGWRGCSLRGVGGLISTGERPVVDTKNRPISGLWVTACADRPLNALV